MDSNNFIKNPVSRTQRPNGFSGLDPIGDYLSGQDLRSQPGGDVSQDEESSINVSGILNELSQRLHSIRNEQTRQLSAPKLQHQEPEQNVQTKTVIIDLVINIKLNIEQ